MQRQILGVLALVLVIAGLIFSLEGGPRQDLAGFCLRIGLILGAIWLALPDLSRPGAGWMLAALGIFAFVVARWPKLTIYAGVFLLALALLRPRIAAYTDRKRS